MRVEVFIGLKNGVLDPQGAAVLSALQHQGFDSAQGVRIGKWITLEIDAPSTSAAEAQAKAMCEALLVNKVIETYQVKAA